MAETTSKGGVEDVTDVLIVGAGPVGLALALDLGRRNIRSTIIERDACTGSRVLAKASVINERSMEYCRLLGVRDGIADAGYPKDLPGDTVFCTAINGKLIGRLEMPSASEREVPPQSSEMLQRCPQLWLDPLLAQAVARQKQAQLRYSTEMVSCEQDDAGVWCTVRHVDDGYVEKLRARYVVGCDGAGSRVRRALGISFEGQELGHTASVIIETEDLAKRPPFGRGAERYMFIHADGVWGNFTTLDGGKLWRFSLVGLQEKIGQDSFDIHAYVQQAFGGQKIAYTLGPLLQWRRSQYVADRYAQGRVFLAGDAAHTMSPTGGHGLNTGLGDASDLSWILQALLQGWGGAALIDAYTMERRPIAIRNGLGSTRNFSIWKDKLNRDQILNDGSVGDEQRLRLGTKMAAELRQEFQSIGLALGYDYSESPLIVSDGSPAPPNEPEVYVQSARPGHRAPHYWLRNDQSTIDLFGTGFVLLCLGLEKVGDRQLLDSGKQLGIPVEYHVILETEVMRLYQRRLVLVRPDGMVAWRGDELPEDLENLWRRVSGSIEQL